MFNRTRRFFALVLFVLTTSTTIFAVPREKGEPPAPRDRTPIIRRIIARVRGFIPVPQEDTLSIPHP